MTESTRRVKSEKVIDPSHPSAPTRSLWISDRAVQIGIAVTLFAALYCALVTHTLPDFAALSAVLALLLALIMAVFVTPRAFCPGYLISLLAFVLSWRVAAMNSASIVEWIAPIAFAIVLAQGIAFAVRDWRAAQAHGDGAVAILSWQLTAIRLYFGLNELGHATEKIFAGEASFHALVATFHGFGLGDYAALFVVAGGLTEFLSAVSVGLGLFARLGAFVSIVYFLIATIGFGHEWTRGYAWASAGGGGWEYVMLVLIVFLSILVGGPGKFSLDGWLLRSGLLPKSLAWLSGGSSERPVSG